MTHTHRDEGAEAMTTEPDRRGASVPPLPGHAAWCDYPVDHPDHPCPTPQPVCSCGHDKSWHEDFREKAAQPCLKCACVAFGGAGA